MTAGNDAICIVGFPEFSPRTCDERLYLPRVIERFSSALFPARKQLGYL
jgi:hypothetical protein